MSNMLNVSVNKVQEHLGSEMEDIIMLVNINFILFLMNVCSVCITHPKHRISLPVQFPLIIQNCLLVWARSLEQANTFKKRHINFALCYEKNLLARTGRVEGRPTLVTRELVPLIEHLAQTKRFL